MTENQYEKLLNINTTGVESLDNATFHYNRYEATPYYILESLIENIELNSTDTVIDFGCGKGRLSFYINHFKQCNVIGIEMNQKLIEICRKNFENYLNIHKKANSEITFYNCLAQGYRIQYTDNIFYFFNPFSLPIFMKVIDNILSSYYEAPRKIAIILYYPSEDYIYYLENNSILNLEKEIRIEGKFNKDSTERLLIYSI